MSGIPTQIGVAFFYGDNFSIESAIVLSSGIQFDDTVLCGTLAETVDGWAAYWRECPPNSPLCERYLSLMGIIKVATVGRSLMDVYNFIVMQDKATRDEIARANRRNRNGPGAGPKPFDYVHRVLSYLCNTGFINLPFTVRTNLDAYIAQRLENLKAVQAARHGLYPIISLEGNEDTIYGQIN